MKGLSYGFALGLMLAAALVLNGCASVCTTGWDASVTTGTSTRYGETTDGTVGLSGGIGKEQCK